ncbi:MAG: SoxR reducing system RseC family protein [Clostridia bacterium]|nr:SoxR reducing system RseC family protein [Clostridia bacterium]
MVESGVVTATKDNLATVSFKRRGECDKCQLCKVSNDCTKVEVVLENTLGVNVGDYVSVEIGKKTHTAAALIYLVPLILVGIGIFIGSILSPLAQGILAVAGLILGLAVALPIDFCVIRKSKRLAPKMKEILSGLPE